MRAGGELRDGGSCLTAACRGPTTAPGCAASPTLAALPRPTAPAPTAASPPSVAAQLALAALPAVRVSPWEAPDAVRHYPFAAPYAASARARAAAWSTIGAG